MLKKILISLIFILLLLLLSVIILFITYGDESVAKGHFEKISSMKFPKDGEFIKSDLEVEDTAVVELLL